MNAVKFEWKCPNCSAPANKCGNEKKASSRAHKFNASNDCSGFICECDGDSEDDHGLTLANPCANAYCYHCEWFGTFPKPHKGLQSWEKKALAAGWTPPESRTKELVNK